MIGITLGEITGIGPEVVLKAIRHFSQKEVKIIGSKSVLEKTKNLLKIDVDYEPYLLDVALPPVDFQFGKPRKKTALYAFQSLSLAVSLLKEKKIKGIVTAPLYKKILNKIGFNYPGHTEFFAHAFNVKDYCMLAYTKAFKVAFVTLHLPLSKVKDSLTTKKIVKTTLQLKDFLTKFEGILSPKIAIFAFNPHIDEFSLGEEVLIKKAIKRLNELRVNAYGPFSADSIFSLLGRYDGYIAMYHDQGMIPAKLISRGAGVNITLGLPFVRTSPLHGTGLDIAGRNLADEKSTITAIKTALRLMKIW